MKAPFFVIATSVIATLVAGQLRAADALTTDQQEAFLRTAKIVKVKDAKKGVTGTLRVTMSDGKLTHDASVQRINDHQAVFQGVGGKTELNFKDSYLFNIAAWKMSKLLGIDDMVPPSVERRYQNDSASFTWWVDDVQMDEEERMAKKIEAPDHDKWIKEIQVMHIYDQLIYNTDSNATNLLIDKQWQIWMIDHTRAFRMQKTLLDPKVLTSCDRNLLAKMKALDAVTLNKEMRNYLEKGEIQGILARRDLIVKGIESLDAGQIYDRPSRH